MVRQVQFFETDRINDLQDMVNAFLRKDIYNLLEVTYNHYSDSNMDHVIYTAMVVYHLTVPAEEEEEEEIEDPVLTAAKERKDRRDGVIYPQ